MTARRVDAPGRRDRVVDAVWSVAVRQGLDAVSARSVAGESGLSLGAVTRTFPTQEELHVVAMRRVTERVADRLAVLVPAGAPVDRAVDLLAQVMPFADATHAEAQVYYSYVARGRSSPALQEVADDVDAALAALCRRAVELVAPRLAAGELEAAARELHALTEGVAFALVTWPHRRDRTAAAAVLRRWLDRLA